MTSIQIPDQAARERALNANTSFIVQAPAGSGKTELLTQRFLVLLSRVEYPEQIIALTFTRKAASEMRARIIKALQLAVSTEAPKSQHQQLTWRLAKRALEKNNILQWNLLANPNRLRIQTIDSMCASLSKQMPLLSGFGAAVPS